MPAFQAILDRYLIKQMRVPFLFGIAIFTILGLFVGVAFQLVGQIAERGLAPGAALQILALRTPTFIVQAIPMSVLLTTLMVYGQLSRQSEITAMKAAGIGPLRLARPAILASLVVALLTFVTSEVVVPPTSVQAMVTQARALNQELPDFRKQNIFYRDFDGKRLNHIFFARGFDGQQMQKISLLQFAGGKLSQIVIAEAGRWDNTNQKWKFEQGTIYELGENNSYRQIEPFALKEIDLPRTPLALATETRRVAQMNLIDAYRFLDLVEQTGDPKRTQKVRLAIQQKLSLPWACLAFGLIGTSLGLRPRRANDAPGFGLSMGIIFSYYILESMLTSLGQGSVISPFIAAWLPELGCLMIGGALMWQTLRQ
jgi:lipopolysaccharide export system permease protein